MRLDKRMPLLQFATVQASRSQTQDKTLYAYIIYLCVDISLYLRRYMCLYVYNYLAGCVLQKRQFEIACALTRREKRMPLRWSPRPPWLRPPRQPLLALLPHPPRQSPRLGGRNVP